MDQYWNKSATNSHACWLMSDSKFNNFIKMCRIDLDLLQSSIDLNFLHAIPVLNRDQRRYPYNYLQSLLWTSLRKIVIANEKASLIKTVHEPHSNCRLQIYLTVKSKSYLIFFKLFNEMHCKDEY